MDFSIMKLHIYCGLHLLICSKFSNAVNDIFNRLSFDVKNIFFCKIKISVYIIRFFFCIINDFISEL